VRSIVVIFVLFTMWTGLTGSLEALLQRGIHLIFVLPLIFFSYPITKEYKPLIEDRKLSPVHIIDLACILISLVTMAWFLWNRTYILFRFPYISPIESKTMIFGWLLIILILESCRRTMGWPLVVLCSLTFIYLGLGPYLPGQLMHSGLEMESFAEYMFLSTEGIFGSLVGLSATYLFMFVAFGQFLTVGGADRFYMDLMFALTGKSPGGPAKVAVLGSAAMATISGSTIANVVSTGSLSIPMMKKVGFKPHIAAAIETAASTGGQIMPPVMGVGIFVMAELTRIPLMKLMKISVLPAFLYFCVIFIFVTRIIKRDGLVGLSEVPDIVGTLRQGWRFILPILFLIIILLLGYTPFRAASMATIVALLMSLFSKNMHINDFLEKFSQACENTVKLMLPLAAISACAAIIITNLTISGLLLKATPIIVSISRGSIFIALLCSMLVCYVFGMGLPIVMSYILTVTLTSGALHELGISMLATHMTIFWWSQLSTISPPICMTAFAAARIAQSDPFKTGFTSLLFGSGLVWIPFLFIYTPLLTGGWIIQIILCAKIGLITFGLISVLYKYCFSKNTSLDLGLIVASIVLLVGSLFDEVPILTLLAVILMCSVAYIQLRRRRQEDVF